MLKKISISIFIFIISIQPVNADENKFTQKFNKFLQCIKKDSKETKDIQIKKWKEVKKHSRKKLKIVQHKFTGFFSDFPELDEKQ